MKAKVKHDFVYYCNLLKSLGFGGCSLSDTIKCSIPKNKRSNLIKKHIRIRTIRFLKLRKHFNIYKKEEIIIIGKDQHFKGQLRYSFVCSLDDKIRYIHSEMVEII